MVMVEVVPTPQGLLSVEKRGRTEEAAAAASTTILIAGMMVGRQGGYQQGGRGRRLAGWPRCWGEATAAAPDLERVLGDICEIYYNR